MDETNHTCRTRRTRRTHRNALTVYPRIEHSSQDSESQRRTSKRDRVDSRQPEILASVQRAFADVRRDSRDDLGTGVGIGRPGPRRCVRNVDTVFGGSCLLPNEHAITVNDGHAVGSCKSYRC